MSHDVSTVAPPAEHTTHAAIDSTILEAREKTFGQALIGSQPFWVTVALAVICVIMGVLQPDSFATFDNVFNITRNFSFIGIMALGLTVVIATGGIDLSVGSIMGLTAVTCGLILQAVLFAAADDSNRRRDRGLGWQPKFSSNSRPEGHHSRVRAPVQHTGQYLAGCVPQ